MLKGTGPLGLRVPAQTKDARAQYRNARNMERWRNGLPMARTAEASRLIFSALTEINRSRLAVGKRQRVLRLLQRPVGLISEALEAYYIGQSFPLLAMNRKIAALAQALQKEMAIGHKIVVETFLSDPSRRIDAKQLLSAVYGAMDYLGATLTKSYQIYVAPPQWLWQEIHHLYLFSEYNNLHKVAIKNGGDDTRQTSIEALYKRILLLALAHPCCLPQRDIARVVKATANWSVFAELSPLSGTEEPRGLFGVDLECDAPPDRHAPEQRHSEHYRILDTSELIRRLRLQSADAAAIEIPKETLRRLILAWSGTPKRSFSRTARENSVTMTLGLEAIHKMVKYSVEYEGGSVDLSTAAAPPPINIGKGDYRDAPTFLCDCTNESAGGCSLVWKIDVPTMASVGVPIGIRHSHAGEPGEWCVGVVRWLRNLGTSKMALGVEMLAPHAAPALIHRMNGENRGNDTYGLLIPELRNMNQPETLVIPTTYREDDELAINVGGDVRRVRLTTLREDSDAFRQFHFVMLDKGDSSVKAARAL